MIVTTSWIAKNYDKYNKLYWNGKLPVIEFKLSRSKHTWGYARYRYNLSANNVTPLSITISNYYDSPENIKLTTLLHEMIHIADYAFNPYHFVKNNKKVSKRAYDPHGWWFKQEANRLAKDGWEIEKYVTSTEKEASVISKRTKQIIKEKQNNALICAIVGTNTTFYCKTQEIHVETLLKTIVGVDWKYNNMDVKNIYFYKTKNEKLAVKRSCATKITGWRCSTTNFMDSVIDKFDLIKTNAYSSKVKETLKKVA